jgi:signal transduction histidine kinase/ligand-binding sensor domain-containing protein
MRRHCGHARHLDSGQPDQDWPAATWAFCVLLTFLLAIPARADRASNWRMFKAADGLHETYTASISVSRAGNVWVKHGDASEISVLDGYHVRTMPSPGRDNYRVYESRTGQLWSIYPLGLVVGGSEGWVYHPVAEIQTEIEADPLRQIRQVPLLPVEQNRVLFLLSDTLMEYDSSARQTTILKRVSETSLGKFLEMSEARDGGLWISGTRGLLKLPGALKRLRPGDAGQEYPVDPTWQLENLQRPFEDSLGNVTVVASDSRGNGQRAVLRLEAGSWHVRPVDSVNIRQAWTAWDGLTWGYTLSSLLRLDPEPLQSYAREKLWAGQYKDVAPDANDAFWLATSEGLLRYAPYLWRTPVPLEDVNSHVHSLVQDQRGSLWLASSDFLVRLSSNQVTTIKWPEGMEGSFEAQDALFSLPDGRLVIAAGARAYLFEPDHSLFHLLRHPSGQPLRFMAQLPNGAVVVERITPEAGATSPRPLEQFDGQDFQPFLQPPSDWSFGPFISAVTALSNGDIWLGGAGGAARWRDGKFELFGPVQGFRAGQVRCFADLGGGRVWCADSGNILEFNGKSWTVLRSGFDRINAIVRGPDEKLWIGTADGLYSFRDASWVQHGVEEGLPNPGVSCVLVDNQRQLWAGTTRGPTRYHPDADPFPPKTSQPILEESSNGHVTGDRATILLNAADKWQQTPGARLLFATRLDEGPWSPYTPNMVKTLEHLGPGRHRLDVRSMDRNWNDDQEPATLAFSVALAWYQDPRLIAGSIALVILAGFAVNRHIRLKHSYAEVEQTVALRTRELQQANEELLQSQKMRALGTLAAGIAHDFNSILSIVKGSAQIIQSNLDDKQKILTRVDRIQAAVEQGTGIVRSILGLSRIKAKDQVPTDINSLVESALRLTGDRLLQEVSLQFKPAPSLPKVPVVKELIQQMLLNLVLNAADAMDGQGEIIIGTSLRHDLPTDLALAPAWAARFVCVSVQDSGCGIAPELLPRIFEPFFTTKALSTRRGTGLGLSVVYEIARQTGYGLEARSAPGKGSTFAILLPVREPEDGA